MQTYTLKLQAQTPFEATVAVSGRLSLYDLAAFLIDTLGFDFDHAFGFYDNLNNPYNSQEKYTLFADMGESEEGDPGVQKTCVEDVFAPEKEMLFLFDYGDDWMFLITCTAVEETKSRRKIRQVLSTEGDPPVQYPDCDEEEETNW